MTISNTIGKLIAKYDWILRKNILEPENTVGDETVPLVSALRNGRQDYRGSIKLEKGFPLTHSGLTSEDRVDKKSTFPFINCVINVPNAEACINSRSLAAGINKFEDFIAEPNYMLKVIGSTSVLISDSFGNTTNPLSTSIDEGVKTVQTDVVEDKYLSATFPLDQNYKVVIKTPTTPLSIILTKNDGETITQAIRYISVTLPPNVLALIEITPQGVTVLKYDSDGNGTFDTQVNPTINVTGIQAQDITPPQIIVNETVQNGTSRIVLEATDEETGVQGIMYSTNGTTFQQYSTPLILNPAQTPKIYAFADDKVANRSGLTEYNLTTSTAGYSVAGPSAAIPGSQITANWTAPGGRPTDDWIGLFRVGTLNSAYISKQYTGGQSSSSLNFALPDQPGVYEFRYLIDDGFASVAASNPITVLSSRRSQFDFDGDGKADVSVFRPNGGNWYLLNSASGFTGAQFGDTNDKIVPADYDGDGKTDIAVYRGGIWYLQRSSTGFTGFAFGDVNDVPQPADFDGDGKADLAVWRPSNGTWYVFNLATNQFSAYQFGASTDKPVVGDYDGDGKADYAVYRPSNGSWYLQRSTQGFTGIQFGEANDKPVPADYDGDGKTDVAVFRPSNGSWYLLRSQLGFTGIQFGISTDLPTPADYDGDGRADVAVFRSGTWYLNRSTAGFTGVQFGAATDKPVPNAFVP